MGKLKKISDYSDHNKYVSLEEVLERAKSFLEEHKDDGFNAGCVIYAIKDSDGVDTIWWFRSRLNSSEMVWICEKIKRHYVE